MRQLESEHIAIRRVDGRILAQDLIAPIASPAFDNSRMDGFAVRHADMDPTGRYLLAHRGSPVRRTGTPPGRTTRECVRITTGPPIPAGADTVAIKENVREQGPDHGSRWSRLGADIRRAGEHARIGDKVLETGSLLSPARISLAAALAWPNSRPRSARPWRCSPPATNWWSPASHSRRARSTTATANC